MSLRYSLYRTSGKSQRVNRFNGGERSCNQKQPANTKVNELFVAAMKNDPILIVLPNVWLDDYLFEVK